MLEHLIRLRGGWERSGTDAGSLPIRLTLPLVAHPEGAGRLRLSRRFQTPRLDPARETLWLRLDAISGLISVILNGRAIAEVPPGGSNLLIPLDVALPARNELILEAELPAHEVAPTAGFHWGEVALVIREAGPTG